MAVTLVTEQLMC